MTEYTGPERRAPARSIEEVEAAFERKLLEHEKREQEWMLAQLEALKKEAFPDGAARHKEYHQSKINAAKEEAEFWKAAKLELTKVGVSAVVSVFKAVAILAILGFLYKVSLGSVAALFLPK